MIVNLNNLSIKEDYKVKGKLTVDNGQNLKILHVGSKVINSHTNTPLYLNNILHVLTISKNLLSIYKFTRDNNVINEIFDICYLFKDKIMGRVLSEDKIKNHFYQMDATKYNPYWEAHQSHDFSFFRF